MSKSQLEKVHQASRAIRGALITFEGTLGRVLNKTIYKDIRGSLDLALKVLEELERDNDK